MPIHDPKDYPQVLARIKDKIARQGIELGPVLTEAEIAAFERECRTRLPEGYRLFLQQIGDGCAAMIDGFPLTRLADAERKDLSAPFRFVEYFVWEAEGSLTDDELDTEVNFALGLQGADRVHVDRRKLDEWIEWAMGNQGLQLIHVGCGRTFELITAGPCAGEVWDFADVGVEPCCERQDFLGWFELWLDDRDDVDYQKDFVYRPIHTKDDSAGVT
ncbi:SMI1/KNR4 family protein [Propionibacterium australiense]|uniref:SMI1/KNR4 family protein n=1 Tax=Propionibacterium australiense TaxID=119981 RepID=A0A383SAL6_9ACTN|nr:SMI1/KNR4 family protein [Propionibacterium australiense]RLP06436.1 SMI1/KNR4 family protein [Propionibacterium australiense]RLP06843.1 SMI1/KNR4 family protein [Propionibacterium australiense]SYZ34464.1 SMI1/KNR4-like domain [Propionibacterium australiense]VEH89989.1 Uncharacterised protein [Propionibacterium australiense]